MKALLDTLLLLAAVVSIAVCVYASVAVLKSTVHDWRRKLLLLAIIWIVPLVGGYLIAWVARRVNRTQRLGAPEVYSEAGEVVPAGEPPFETETVGGEVDGFDLRGEIATADSNVADGADGGNGNGSDSGTGGNGRGKPP